MVCLQATNRGILCTTLLNHQWGFHLMKSHKIRDNTPSRSSWIPCYCIFSLFLSILIDCNIETGEGGKKTERRVERKKERCRTLMVQCLPSFFPVSCEQTGPEESICDCVEGQETMASRGQKASCAHSHGCIKQGMKYSDMAVRYFEENCPPRAHTHKGICNNSLLL